MTEAGRYFKLKQADRSDRGAHEASDCLELISEHN